MKEEVRYRWRIQWSGRWTTTKHHCTEDVIKREHPEAVAVEGTRQVILIPSTPEELAQAMYGRMAGR